MAETTIQYNYQSASKESTVQLIFFCLIAFITYKGTLEQSPRVGKRIKLHVSECL